LGGKSIVPPSDIPNVGRFAVIQDAVGAHISIFQPGQHKGLTAFGETGNLCWADLHSNEPDKATKFYGEWLGWRFETGNDGYTHIANGTSKDDMIGGIMPKMMAPPGTPPHWLPYFHVKDAKAAGAKAAQLGAKTLMPAALMENVGTIGVLADPQGAVFSIYQPLG
jgi:predicted enzyme related to lactoylglutathione lyase